MKILITGANGFVGKNLAAHLLNSGDFELLKCGRNTTKEVLAAYTASCEAVFHLAGVNRPEHPAEFEQGNRDFTAQLLGCLKESGNTCPIIYASSVQAELDNPYGRSKWEAEELLFTYAEQTGARVCVYRLPNLFGKWCRPHYNSVVATFCHLIAREMPITVHDEKTSLSLLYIDDVIAAFLEALRGQECRDGQFCVAQPVYTVSIGELAVRLRRFRAFRRTLDVPTLSDAFEKKLYSTYLSYLAPDNFAYALKMNEDARGTFTELLRMQGSGQVSVSISHPGVQRGQHWHHTKLERFMVVYGCGVIRFRRIDSDEVLEYAVSGKKMQVVDIPPGYIHSVENTGESDLILLMWCNECFYPEQPDTIYKEV